ncbi:tRNA-guanine(15) transglycosylase-like protein [Tribonema minus]|uniref:tRNA-guanine(15) transglycosylase-like protein n=1 Tax=Tribonema minus TaxID=303371 RepID=A0A836CCU6_9STRA|nr:tRNA-guanine(15) transglycosylase-like protein [Tribonema minus]
MATDGHAAEPLVEHKPRGPNLKNPPLLPEDQWPTYPGFNFEILHRDQGDSDARTGRLTTPHGVVETPAFIFCATKAAIKGLTMEQMKACDTQIVLSNTYHLHVQPGSEAIRDMGGLQKATNWRGPMLTDSGGYQIFSMGHGSVSDEIKGRRGATDANPNPPSLLSIGEKGARFKSYHDGSIKQLSPETSIQIQRDLGADLILVLDECTPFHVDKEYTAASTRRSHRWALRSLNEFVRTANEGAQQQALYGIIQGGVYRDLRAESAAFVNAQPFFGIAVGGSLGASAADMYRVVDMTMAMVRRDRPVHLLGIGGVADIFNGVSHGIGTFDCVHPTRLGRHGGALVRVRHWPKSACSLAVQSSPPVHTNPRGIDTFDCVHPTRLGRHGGALVRARHWSRGGGEGQVPRASIQLAKGQFRGDARPVDAECGCPTCAAGYSRAYLHHCVRAGELVGGALLTQHNVWTMNALMADVRAAIAAGTPLEQVEDHWLAPGLRSADIVAADAMRRGGAAAAAAGDGGDGSVAATHATGVAAAAGGRSDGGGAGGGSGDAADDGSITAAAL